MCNAHRLVKADIDAMVTASHIGARLQKRCESSNSCSGNINRPQYYLYISRGIVSPTFNHPPFFSHQLQQLLSVQKLLILRGKENCALPLLGAVLIGKARSWMGSCPTRRPTKQAQQHEEDPAAQTPVRFSALVNWCFDTPKRGRCYY